MLAYDVKNMGTMTREELLLACRYYNGEEEIPITLPEGKEIFWDYERVWVKWVLEGSERLQENIDYFTEEYDLPNLLPESDGTPLGLKALLFNRYDHWVGFMGGSRDEYAQQFKNGIWVNMSQAQKPTVNY